jgi:hypothetical protein
MRRKLFIRCSLLAIALALVGTATHLLRAKSAGERFTEMYAAIAAPGPSYRDLETHYGFPSSRAAGVIEMLAIYNALYSQWPNVPNGIGGLEFRDRKHWLGFMQSDAVEWRVWEHPHDKRQWIAVADWDFSRGHRISIYKLRCGF